MHSCEQGSRWCCHCSLEHCIRSTQHLWTNRTVQDGEAMVTTQPRLSKWQPSLGRLITTQCCNDSKHQSSIDGFNQDPDSSISISRTSNNKEITVPYLSVEMHRKGGIFFHFTFILSVEVSTTLGCGIHSTRWEQKQNNHIFCSDLPLPIRGWYYET